MAAGIFACFHGFCRGCLVKAHKLRNSGDFFFRGRAHDPESLLLPVRKLLPVGTLIVPHVGEGLSFPVGEDFFPEAAVVLSKAFLTREIKLLVSGQTILVQHNFIEGPGQVHVADNEDSLAGGDEFSIESAHVPSRNQGIFLEGQFCLHEAVPVFVTQLFHLLQAGVDVRKGAGSPLLFYRFNLRPDAQVPEISGSVLLDGRSIGA